MAVGPVCLVASGWGGQRLADVNGCGAELDGSVVVGDRDVIDRQAADLGRRNARR
jgi:hypothetical protein